ncbi:MAG: SusC/RagA family TonB-linked outer membrane protein [Bacteroidetes bacterium]|nr:SusC/RagA family TonB-linked outer membrane protein [Bacteroidota bacterium]
MRKLVVLLSVLMLTFWVGYAQAQTTSGKVTDEQGQAIPFASIKVKNGKTGVSADANGTFLIKVANGTVLTVSSVGYMPKDVVADENNRLVIQLSKSTDASLSEVIVTTAFGVKQEQRTTPFSAQVIKSDALNIIPQTNLNDALVGKVAGVQFRSQSGTKLSSQSFARIRGGLALSGDVGPIFVVNGTIIGNSYDIDPDNVESITVLKGANATALFGGAAANGAIVVTTKKGSVGMQSITISQGVTFDRVSRLMKLQNEYAGGGVDHLTVYTWKPGDPEEWKALDGKSFPDYTDDASWGPRMLGQEYIPWYAFVPGTPYSYKTASLTPQPDNIRDFWNHGYHTNSNVSFAKGGDGYNVRMSYSKEYIAGLIPDSKSDRNTLTLAADFDLNKYISAGVDLTFTTQKINGEFDDGYANNSSGNFGQWNHRDLDLNLMRQLKDYPTPIGTVNTWNWGANPDGYSAADPGGFYKANYWYNFYAYQDNIQNNQRRDRLYGNTYVKVKINNNLSVKGTVRRDEFVSYYENITTSLLEASGGQTGTIAGYATGNYNYSTTDYELVANYNQSFFNNDLGVTALVGGDMNRYIRKDNEASTTNGLKVPYLYSIANSKDNPGFSNTRLEQQTNSWFASGSVEYKKFVSATFALRQDYSSTLPAGDNSLFYPSVGMAFTPSEFFKDKISWLSFTKVYGSWGKKPLNLGIYATNFGYGVASNTYNGNFLMSFPDNIPDPALRGSLITSFEGGVELRFLKNRFGLNVNYYNEKMDDQPVSIQVAGESGVTSKTVNAASVKRQGLEFTFDGKIINNKNFSWSVTKTVGWLINNPVTQIIEGQDKIQPGGWIGSFGSRYASAYQVLNQDWGQLQGGGFILGENNQPEIDPNTGLYITGDPNYSWGSIVPKLTGGFQSLMTYKNFNLNISLDYQSGGHFFSLSESWGMYSGLLDYTAETNDRGANVRDPLSEGGGVHVVGVSSVDGKTPIDMYVDGFTYFHQFYGSKIAAPFIHKLSYIKLREVSLGYNLPVKNWSFTNKWLKGATVSAVASSPWIIYSDSKNFDPSEISGVYGEDGNLPPVRSIGFNVKLNF